MQKTLQETQNENAPVRNSPALNSKSCEADSARLDALPGQCYTFTANPAQNRGAALKGHGFSRAITASMKQAFSR
jgi:hypothetical protein